MRKRVGVNGSVEEARKCAIEQPQQKSDVGRTQKRRMGGPLCTLTRSARLGASPGAREEERKKKKSRKRCRGGLQASKQGRNYPDLTRQAYTQRNVGATGAKGSKQRERKRKGRREVEGKIARGGVIILIRRGNL